MDIDIQRKINDIKAELHDLKVHTCSILLFQEDGESLFCWGCNKIKELTAQLYEMEIGVK